MAEVKYRFLIRGPLSWRMPRRRPKYVEVAESVTLEELHEAVYEQVRDELTGLRGYDEAPYEHLHAFGLPDGVVIFSSANGDRVTSDVLLEGVALTNGKLRYTYDLGDCWQYDLILRDGPAKSANV